jgi:hypothetical protein
MGDPYYNSGVRRPLPGHHEERGEVGHPIRRHLHAPEYRTDHDSSFPDSGAESSMDILAIVLGPHSIMALVHSTHPFVCGWATAAQPTRMLLSSQKSRNFLR